MFERNQSFGTNGKNFEDIQQRIEDILRETLSYSTEGLKIGESLFRINYYNENSDELAQKTNRITILQEKDKKIYIQIKGQISNDEIGVIWSDLEKEMQPIIQNEELMVNQNNILKKIIELIKLRGYIIDKNQAQNFLDNFIEKFNRLPKDDEINSIVKGYIIMVNEDYLLNKTEVTNPAESLSEIKESVLEIMEKGTNSYLDQSSVTIMKGSIERRKCPKCGDEGAIYEVTDKSIVLMDYPRIYGKKKYCGKCSFEWR
ncbi:MAG: hypothetical protein ACFFEN_11055 [Candidatus Thorarchaeota archaeon]